MIFDPISKGYIIQQIHDIRCMVHVLMIAVAKGHDLRPLAESLAVLQLGSMCSDTALHSLADGHQLTVRFIIHAVKLTHQSGCLIHTVYVASSVCCPPTGSSFEQSSISPSMHTSHVQQDTDVAVA